MGEMEEIKGIRGKRGKRGKEEKEEKRKKRKCEKILSKFFRNFGRFYRTKYIWFSPGSLSWAFVLCLSPRLSS